MQLYPSTIITTFSTTVISFISANVITIVAIFGFIVGLSIIMALFDQAADDRYLKNYRKRWGMK